MWQNLLTTDIKMHIKMQVLSSQLPKITASLELLSIYSLIFNYCGLILIVNISLFSGMDDDTHCRK